MNSIANSSVGSRNSEVESGNAEFRKPSRKGRVLPRFYPNFLLMVALVLSLWACREENPDLLNAPIGSDSIRVRMLNLVPSADSRQLELEGSIRTNTVGLGMLSANIGATSDSLYTSVSANSLKEFTSKSRIHFGRKSFQTVLALPKISVTQKTDTIFTVSTLFTPEYRAQKSSYLRFFNAFPESQIAYSLRLGCPNGTIISTPIPFRSLSAPLEVSADEYIVSLIRHNADNSTTVAGYYKFSLNANNDFLFVVYQKINGEHEVLLLDERGYGATALLPIKATTESESEVRGVNLSSEIVSLRKAPAETIASGLASLRVSGFSGITACSSENADTLGALIGGNFSTTSPVSLEVGKRYTLIVADSGAKKAAISAIAKPYKLSVSQGDSAVVRAVHLAWNQPPLTLSLGGRTTQSGIFRSGEIIASRIALGNVSAPILLQSGVAPFAIFTADAPVSLVQTGISRLEKGKSYLLLISTTPNGTLQLALLRDDEQNAPIQILEKGVFTQIVNAVPDAPSLACTYGSTLSNTTIAYGGSVATVLPAGVQNFSVGGKSEQISLDEAKRTLVLLSGDASLPDFTVISTEPMNAPANEFRRRFINACKETPQIVVSQDDPTKSYNQLFADPLAYRAFTASQTGTLERSVTLFFWYADSANPFARTDNVRLLLGSNYSIIFAGKKSAGGYRAILQQEF